MSEKDEREALLARLAALDLSALRRLSTLAAAGPDNATDSGQSYLDFLTGVSQSDIGFLKEAEKSYGNSWKLRGGVDTFHMLRRKWERIESTVAQDIKPAASSPGANPYDIFEHITADRRADGFIDDVRDLRRYLMLVEAEMTVRREQALPDSGRRYLDQLAAIAAGDVAVIAEKEKSYGNAWKRAGGIGAFMMFARKWDRIQQRVVTRIEPAEGAPGAARDNVLDHIVADRRTEGVMADIRDLRQYLLLVEAEMIARGVVAAAMQGDDPA